MRSATTSPACRPTRRGGTAIVGQHWGIEAALGARRQLCEDLSRKRAGHSAQNFSLITRIALNLLKQDKSSTRGIKGKRLKAGWNHDYLLKLLGI